MTRGVQIRRLRTAAAFLQHVADLGVDIPFDDSVASDGPLSTPVAGAANRFAVLPMEGWDGTDDGRPTDLVRRRWRRFGESGATLIWGGEAVAVTHAGRANPHQLVISDELGSLREELVRAHHARFSDDLVVGLQLTHSGRFSVASRVSAYEHPMLEERWPARRITDAELDDLVGSYVAAASTASECGFDFVDVKCCHGYLAHELLSGVERVGRYGGDLSGRSAFLQSVVAGIRAAVPGLRIGVRMSVFDVAPHVEGPDGLGVPAPGMPIPYSYAFGGDGSGTGVDDRLREPVAVLRALAPDLVCVTGGSPYYSPHVQRPAFFPPSDGYQPPEDPLIGVARLLWAARTVRRALEGTPVVASGLSYLQQWLPNVAQAVIRHGWADSVGVGRMVLAYHDLPADVLAGRALDDRRICRTFSDCTTAPRNGLVSGCWPLDPFYKERPDRVVLAAAKRSS